MVSLYALVVKSCWLLPQFSPFFDPKMWVIVRAEASTPAQVSSILRYCQPTLQQPCGQRSALVGQIKQIYGVKKG
jgi:hypothetical protein